MCAGNKFLYGRSSYHLRQIIFKIFRIIRAQGGGLLVLVIASYPDDDVSVGYRPRGRRH